MRLALYEADSRALVRVYRTSRATLLQVTGLPSSWVLSRPWEAVVLIAGRQDWDLI